MILPYDVTMDDASVVRVNCSRDLSAAAIGRLAEDASNYDVWNTILATKVEAVVAIFTEDGNPVIPLAVASGRWVWRNSHVDEGDDQSVAINDVVIL